MEKSKEAKNLDATTEEKIKAAARIVFHQKGFAATRTRDIAEEAGINLALVNYYFRSKEKLFSIIMTETLSSFVQTMTIVLNDETSTLEKKVEQIASNYIDLLIEEPEVPVFIMSEIRVNPGMLLEKLPVKQLLTDSAFVKQYLKGLKDGKVSEPNPLHFLMNLLGLVIFPFIGKPLMKQVGGVNDIEFNKLMQERKKLIPLWIKSIIKTRQTIEKT